MHTRLVGPLVLLGLIALGSPTSTPGPQGDPALRDGVLDLRVGSDLSLDRWEICGEGGRLWLHAGESRRDLGLASEARTIRSALALRLTGTLETAHSLRIEAPRLSIAGSVQAQSLSLQAEGLLELEPEGSLRLAPGAELRLEADYLSLVGSIDAPGGRLSVQARGFLHQGPIVLDACHETAAGWAVIDCDRYVGSIRGTLLARDPAGLGGSIELLAKTSLFSSGRFDVSGAQGGSLWISGRDTRLVGAQLDASGVERAGAIRVGSESKDARPDGMNAWHADSFLSTRGTRFRADSASGDAGEVVVGATRSTQFGGEVLVCSASGRGGRVEVSSSGDLHYAGELEAQGPSGPGALLLDPQNLELNDTTGLLAQIALVDPNPNGNQYGERVLALSGGNVVVTDDQDDLGAATAGAVYLFSGTTGALIATLTGSTAGDQVSASGIVTLTNGNYVVRSSGWDDGGTANVGAATWGNGATGVSGSVTTTNSLHGSTTGDGVSNSGLTALANGNYVVLSGFWINGGATNAGAATWGNGTTGISGPVTTTNSLHGSTTGDLVSVNGVVALTNGNYVVRSRTWNNGGTITDAGAATWGNGTTGISGPVTTTNSLHGSTAADYVSGSGVVALTNGNYVVQSGSWDDGTAAVGAATWGNGATGISGPVTTTNSLHGSTAGDGVSGDRVTALTNGNYVVRSANWNNGGVGNAGAATWGNGATGITGPVTTTNSLHGSVANDQVGLNGVGFSGVTALTNGNYVVRSANWNNGGVGNAGAATWGNGATGITGPVTTTNSLHGSVANDQVGLNGVGFSGVTALTNGNYVVRSANWNNGATLRVGAATWGNGTTGITGPVTTANSLHGSTASDNVSSRGVVALTNGNYVVWSPVWDNGGAGDAGAATWGNGATGISGPITTANSLHGSTAADFVSFQGVVALTNGNYVVLSANWNNGATVDAGAATWGNGATGVSGPVTTTNSLHGSSTSDEVSRHGVVALTNGNYVVMSANWDNGGTANAGALSFGSGLGATAGPVSAANSVVGTATAGTTTTSGLNSGFAGGLRGVLAAVVFPVESTTFGIAPGQTITSPTARITQLLSAGTNVTLQASQDLTISSPITVNNPTGNGGTLTLIAGRNVIINAAITTDNGNFEARANSDAAAGVVDADRGAGAGSVQNTSTIDAGTGTIRFETQAGVGLTNNTRADYTLGTLTAATTTVVPFATSTTPTAVTAGTTQVTIQGGGLSGATVTVGGVGATSVTVVGSTLNFTPAVTTPAGTQTVLVTVSGVAVNVGTLTVTAGAGAGGGGGGVRLPGAGTQVFKTKGKDCSIGVPDVGSDLPLHFLALLLGLFALRVRRS